MTHHLQQVRRSCCFGHPKGCCPQTQLCHPAVLQSFSETLDVIKPVLQSRPPPCLLIACTTYLRHARQSSCKFSRVYSVHTFEDTPPQVRWTKAADLNPTQFQVWHCQLAAPLLQLGLLYEVKSGYLPMASVKHWDALQSPKGLEYQYSAPRCLYMLHLPLPMHAWHTTSAVK